MSTANIAREDHFHSESIIKSKKALRRKGVHQEKTGEKSDFVHGISIFQ